MKKIFVMMMVLSGCASQQSVEGVNRSLIGLSTAFNHHVEATQKAHGAIYDDVADLRNRVCELEAKVTRMSKLLDRKFVENIKK